MHKLSIVSAVVLCATAASADAAYTFTLPSVVASGQLTTTVVGSMCPNFGICSQTTQPYSPTVNGPLSGAVDQLQGTFILSGYNPATRLGYDVTLSFLNGALQSSSLTGFSEFISGPCPGCTVTSGTFSAANFAVNVRNTSTNANLVVAPVPEPSTWALMLIGFGAVGYSMRRRQRRGQRQTAAS